MQAADLLRPDAADVVAFRDPDARVYAVSDRILRAIPQDRVAEFQKTQTHPAVAALIERGALIGSTFVPAPPAARGDARAAAYVEHPAIDFASYPYEWPFAALRAAALHHLDLQLELIQHGFAIRSGSAYHLQFQGVRPVFVDPTVIRPYRDGEPWAGLATFRREFLYPLLLTSRVGLPFQPWYRGAGDGVDTRTLAMLFPRIAALDPRVRRHVHAPLRESEAATATALPRAGFVKLLRGLRSVIAGLEPKRRKAARAAALDLPGANEQIAKFDVVRDFVGRVHPGMLLDLSCGGGDYSALALRSGAAAAVGVDADADAADQAFRRAERTRRDLLVLTMDVAEPSPAQGWPHRERRSFAERARFDALLALRILPHLVLERGVAVEDAVRWLVRLAPAGVIEFDPASEAAAQPASEAGYDETSIAERLAAEARIVRRDVVAANGRTLFVYDRR